MNGDEIKIEILADGTIKIETDRIGPANHLSAERFIKEAQRLAGGATKITRKVGKFLRGQHDHSHTQTGGH